MSGYGTEPEATSNASPTITTCASITTSGGSLVLDDTATLSNGYNPTGTITFTLYGPVTSGGASTKLYTTKTVSVSGDGTYTAPTYTLPSSPIAGVYIWDASYGGDGNNNTATDNNDSNEEVTVGNVCSSQTQPLSYWCGSQGQGLINCLNGGSTCTNLPATGWHRLARTCSAA